jgi:hypothetical protein
MSLYPFKAQQVGEPSVAIHDEGHMLWHRLSSYEQRHQAPNAMKHMIIVARSADF